MTWTHQWSDNQPTLWFAIRKRIEHNPIITTNMPMAKLSWNLWILPVCDLKVDWAHANGLWTHQWPINHWPTLPICNWLITPALLHLVINLRQRDGSCASVALRASGLFNNWATEAWTAYGGDVVESTPRKIARQLFVLGYKWELVLKICQKIRVVSCLPELPFGSAHDECGRHGPP